MGGNFANGKGNATVFFSWQQQNPVLQNSRDFSECSLTGNATGNHGGYNCVGSSTSFPGRFTDFSNYNFTIANAAGDVRPYVGSKDSFNFAPYNYFQRPDTRYLANFFAHYDALPEVRAYTEFDFMNDHTLAQIAPSGAFLQTFTLHNDNPLLSQSFKDAVGLSDPSPTVTLYIGRRNIEGGGRIADFTHQQFRIVAGAKGSLWEDKWNYNAWWQTGQNTTNQIYRNDFSVAAPRPRVRRDHRPRDRPAGVPVVRRRQRQELRAVRHLPHRRRHAGGPQLPADAGIPERHYVAEHRGHHRDLRPRLELWLDAAVGAGTASASRSASSAASRSCTSDGRRVRHRATSPARTARRTAVNGQFTVVEPYAEIRVPIMQRQPWAYDLSMNAAYRYSDYNTGIHTNSYGIGAEWAPVKEGKLRGSYQQAVRAANIIELFTPQFINLYNGGDPCAGPNPDRVAGGMSADRSCGAAVRQPRR